MAGRAAAAAVVAWAPGSSLASADLPCSAGRMRVGCGLPCCPVPGVGRAATQPPTHLPVGMFGKYCWLPGPFANAVSVGGMHGLGVVHADSTRAVLVDVVHTALGSFDKSRTRQARFCLHCTALETELQGPRLGRQPSAARHGNCSRRGCNTALRRTPPRCWYVTPRHCSPRPATSSRHTGHLGCRATYGAEPMGGCIAHVVYVCWVRVCCGQGAVWGLRGGYPVHRWRRLSPKGVCTASALPPTAAIHGINMPNAKRRTKPAKMGLEDGWTDEWIVQIVEMGGRMGGRLQSAGVFVIITISTIRCTYRIRYDADTMRTARTTSRDLLADFRRRLLLDWNSDSLDRDPRGFPEHEEGGVGRRASGVNACRYLKWMGVAYTSSDYKRTLDHLKVCMPRKHHTALMRFWLGRWDVDASRFARGPG
ncbi:hypothetical protein PLESTM_000274600 [Pleodorina starrii]|nr:hypothetical protein PLESTM_000274600 [Pleodorina starrii]